MLSWTTCLNHFSQNWFAEELMFGKQGSFSCMFDLTSKLNKLVYYCFASDSNKIYEYRLKLLFRWKANLPISKTVKTIFLNVYLQKNENSANRSHFAMSWIWRQNLMNRSSAVLLLIPTKSWNSDNLSIWYGMPISQSVRPCKPFFPMFICWRMKIWQTWAILPLVGLDVKTRWIGRISAVLPLIPTKSENLNNLSVWYEMPISQSVRLWKPFFIMLICWQEPLCRELNLMSKPDE